MIILMMIIIIINISIIIIMIITMILLLDKRELEHRIPGVHTPVYSRRFPEIGHR